MFRKFTAIALGVMGWAVGWGLSSLKVYQLQDPLYRFTPLQYVPNSFYVSWTFKLAGLFAVGFLVAGLITGIALRLLRSNVSVKQIAFITAVWSVGAALVGFVLITLYRLSHTHPLVDFPFNPVNFFQIFVSPLGMGILGIVGGVGTAWAAGLSDPQSHKNYIKYAVSWAVALIVGALIVRAFGKIEFPFKAYTDIKKTEFYLTVPALVGGFGSSLIGHAGLVLFGFRKTD